jgi:hypothetical protein
MNLRTLTPLLALALLFAAPAYAINIKSSDRTCQKDEDCELITIGCAGCGLKSFEGFQDAVNKDHAADYAKLKRCNPNQERTLQNTKCGDDDDRFEAVCTNHQCAMQKIEKPAKPDKPADPSDPTAAKPLSPDSPIPEKPADAPADDDDTPAQE